MNRAYADQNNMIIVECGSTKAEWMVADGVSLVRTIITPGYNPVTHPMPPELPVDLKSHIDSTYEIHFYGAGVNSKDAEQQIQYWLKTFQENLVIHAYSDLLASCRALFGDGSGIACILGTGSNAGRYDGKDINILVPSLGYILGDEGSGAEIGVEIIKSYFYQTMPRDIKGAFYDKFQLDKNTLLKNVYEKQQANTYLANFATFLSEINHPWKTDLLYRVFQSFFDQKIKPYLTIGDLPVGFTGSIAKAFEVELRTVLADNHVHIQSIIAKPSEALFEYHVSKIKI